MDNSKFKWQQPDRRIAQALRQRSGEVCKTSANRVSPSRFGDLSSFATQVKEILWSEKISPWMENPAIDSASPPRWIDSEEDGLAFLRRLALGESPPMNSKDTSPQENAGTFLKTLHDNKSEWFRFLIQRYQCPLNLRLDSEKDVAEFLLYQLMVSKRVKLDKGNLDSLNHDELLLMLNFIAVHAAGSTDLRFIDSLNYYYERLPVSWKPEGGHPWLLISFYALYARALVSGG
jgi:hypothetical protein